MIFCRCFRKKREEIIQPVQNVQNIQNIQQDKKKRLIKMMLFANRNTVVPNIIG